jgi:hypothetical protein
MVASGGDYLYAAHPGYLLYHSNVPSEVKGTHVYNGPDSLIVSFLQGRYRLLYDARTVDKFRVGMLVWGQFQRPSDRFSWAGPSDSTQWLGLHELIGHYKLEHTYKCPLFR